jgi:hypothetical protein
VTNPATSTVAIRTATNSDAELCAGILTVALADDPVSRWLVAEHHDRWRIHYRYFQRFVRHGLDVGTVEIAGDAACAVWFPFGAPDAVDLDDELAVLCEQYAERFALFGRIMHDRHPKGPAHDYLMLLGAKPDQQSRGMGSSLLAHHHAALDPVATPSYLEATTRRSAEGVYTRAGYRPLGEPIQFPEGLQIYPLWRDPQPTRERCDVRVIIAGGGIGGMATALSLHTAGLTDVEVYESAASIRELGVGPDPPAACGAGAGRARPARRADRGRCRAHRAGIFHQARAANLGRAARSGGRAPLAAVGDPPG